MKKLILIILFFTSCSPRMILDSDNLGLDIYKCNNLQNTVPELTKSPINEVFVIGHLYGDRYKEDDEIPLKVANFFEGYRSNSNTYIALTGDVVKEPTIEAFEKVNKFLNNNSIGYFISPGNHDIYPSSSNYQKVFKYDFYFKEFNNFLLISANFSTSDWLPSDEQKAKINNLINNTSKEYIILLSHQIFWFKDIDFEFKPNSFALLEKELKKNSLNWIESVNNKNFIIISGDSGAYGQDTMCYLNDNKLFIANGIGNFDDDTILKISELEEILIIEEIPLNN
jgi:hypothetical protein